MFGDNVCNKQMPPEVHDAVRHSNMHELALLRKHVFVFDLVFTV